MERGSRKKERKGSRKGECRQKAGRVGEGGRVNISRRKRERKKK